MAKRLQRSASIAVPRRIRPRIDSTAITSLFKRVDPSTRGLSTEETPTLPQVPIDLDEAGGGGAAGGGDAAGTRAGPAAGATQSPSADPAPGSRRAARGRYETPTLQLTPLEVDAIAHGSVTAYMAEPEPDASSFRTVEGVRLARGSSSIPSTVVPSAVNARGPRRARETMRAEKIKSQPVTPDRPSRKR
jgi:hypothetical protein